MGLHGQGADNAVPDVRRRDELGNFSGPGGKPLLPFGDPARKAALTRHALFSRGTVGAFKHAQRILGREQFVFRQAVMVECLAHCSRHAFSLNIARRTSSSWFRAHFHTRCKILIGAAVEKCPAQSGAFMRCEVVEAAV